MPDKYHFNHLVEVVFFCLGHNKVRWPSKRYQKTKPANRRVKSIAMLSEHNNQAFQHDKQNAERFLPSWLFGVYWGGQNRLKILSILLIGLTCFISTSSSGIQAQPKIPSSFEIKPKITPAPSSSPNIPTTSPSSEPSIGKTLQGAATFKENVEEDPLSPFYYPSDPDVMENHPLKAWTDELPPISELKDQLLFKPEDPELNYQLGMKYYYTAHSDKQAVQEKSKEIYDQAIQYFLTAQRFDPDSVNAKLALGTTYLAQDRIEDAGEMFQRALEIDPYNPDVLERTGAYLSRQGNFSAASAYLKKAIELKEDHSTAYFYNGFTVTKKQAVYKERQQDSALTHLETAKHMHPSDPATLALIGHQQKYKGKVSLAARYYEDALAVRPGYMPASLGLADIHKDNGDVESEIAVLKKASQIHPKNDPVKVRIGDLYWKRGQLDLAAHYYQKILMNNPDDPIAKKALADVRQEQVYRNKLGDNGWSTANYVPGEYGIDTKPGLMNTHITGNSGTAATSGFVPVSAGQRSRSEYTGGLTETASNHHQRFQQAELYLDRYQFEDAERAIVQAIKSTTTAQEAYQYGQILTEMGLPDMAIEAFIKSKELSPMFNNRASTEISRASQRLNASLEAENSAKLNMKEAPDSAEDILKNALTYNIRNAEAHYYLAMIQEDRKNYRDAMNHYYAFTQLKPTDIRSEKALKKINKLKYK